MKQAHKIERILDLLYTQDSTNIDLAVVLLESWEEGRAKKAYWMDLANRVGMSFAKLFGKSLFLRRTDEAVLNEVVEQLPRFEKLSLMRGHLPTLPESLRGLERLKLLYCFEIQLEKLPDWIDELQSLEYLSVIGGFLRDLSPAVGQLRALRGLSIRNTHLSTLCDMLGLKELITLDLPQNNIHRIPDSVAALETLSDLHLEYNYLTELPQGLQKLRYLHRLTLGHNRLKEWPAQLYFPQLSFLSLEYNQLFYLPTAFFQQKKLRYLNLAFNPLEELPDLWQELNHLEELNLSNYKGAFPASLWRCTSLKKLYLNKTAVRTFPIAATQLSRLEEFSFNGHQLEDLPEPFPHFPVLRKLDLQNNGLTRLSSDLSYLTGLETLNLKRNPLSEAEQLRIARALPKTKILFGA